MHAIESFGRWLRHQRRALDLTQDELARQVGCAPITIRKLEGDEMRPSKQLAESLAGPLGISLDQRESFVRFARTESKGTLNNQFAAFEHISPAKESEVQLPSVRYTYFSVILAVQHSLFNGWERNMFTYWENISVFYVTHLQNGTDTKLTLTATLSLRCSRVPLMRSQLLLKHNRY